MLTENMTWGVVPEGFSKIADDHGNLLIVRKDREKVVDVSVCTDLNRTQEAVRYQGRGTLRSIRLPDGDRALVRSYLHGGLLRYVTREWFLLWPPRPFRELNITEELRRRGIPTVEVYAACVRRVCGPFYRGWLVTRELGNAQDLWSALQNGFFEQAGRPPSLKAIAASIRAMHREGVYHRDLNLKNILVRRSPCGVESYIIDFDNARMFLGKLSPELVKRNLDRLLRSARKLDPERKLFSTDAWDEFLKFYYGTAEA